MTAEIRPGRILGLDYGDKTVGVAVSDALGFTAQGLEIIRRAAPESLKASVARIREICEEYDVKRIVIGYPKNMNNSEGDSCEKVRVFRDRLKGSPGLKQMEYIFVDERLTTVAADNAMREAELSREERRKYVDKIAAVFILQTYLDTKK